MNFYIAVPVYNAEAFLADCVNSVLAQTVQDFEIVLVDDGSPDGSGALCDTFAGQDERIHVIHQKNTGPYGARRTAIRFLLEHGSPEDRVVFLDADDSLKPNALEVIRHCVEEAGADLVFLGEDQVFEGQILRPFPVDMAYTGTVTDQRLLYKIVFQDGWYNPLWKKVPALSLLPREDHPEFYPVRFGEDLLQSIPLYRDCQKAVFLPDSLYNYTQNPNSATNGLGYEKYKVSSLVLETCWNFLRGQNVWTEADFIEYMTWLRRLTRFQVWLVAKFSTAISNRCELLRQIAEDAFYAKIIATAPRKDLCLRLMQKKHFRTLCLLGTGMRKAGDLRRKARKD